MSVDVKVATLRAEARIGSVIKDKWRLDRLLGVGGMASVYAATHRNKKRAAVKMLHVEYSTDTAIRERFLREGYLANSVGHRGVVTVDDDDLAEDGSAFIVMELLEGETLEQRWRRKGRRLPLGEVLAVVDQVLDALSAAHDRGVVHRDLKPENLFLTNERVVKLLDFGIGRLKEMPVATNTVSGAAMGTPAFMAPEQAKGKWEDVDGQTDLWALGATAFTLLSGEHVHAAGSVNELLALACTQPARSLRSVRPDLPAAVVALFDRSLSFGKGHRFPDARAMQAEVRRVYAELSGSAGTQASLHALPEPSASLPPVREGTDPRLRLTTARGVSASRLPSPPRPLWGAPSARWAFIGGAVALGGLLVAWASGSLGGDEAVVPASAALPSVTSPPVVPSLQVPAASASAEVPHVSIDELPREPAKGASGSAKPAKKERPLPPTR